MSAVETISLSNCLHYHDGSRPSTGPWAIGGIHFNLTPSTTTEGAVRITWPGGYVYWHKPDQVIAVLTKLIDACRAQMKAFKPCGLTLVNRITGERCDYPGGMTVSLVGDLFVVLDSDGQQIGEGRSILDYVPAPMTKEVAT